MDTKALIQNMIDETNRRAVKALSEPDGNVADRLISSAQMEDMLRILQSPYWKKVS